MNPTTRQRWRRWRRLLVPVGGFVLLSALWQPANAGITSLYADDATLVEQLVQLMEIKGELEAVSDGMRVTAAATQDMANAYFQTEAAIQELQAYGPDAFWRDFKSDLYKHYPGFEYLERDKNLRDWNRSTTQSPIEAYDLIGAAFGDMTAELRAKRDRGELDTRSLELHRFEGAGALSLSSEAAAATEAYDRDAALLAEQAGRVRAGDEADVLSAKALVQIASQQSQIIRLLSRQVRLDGIDAALQYRAELEALSELDQVDRNTKNHLEAAAKPPRLMQFDPLW